MIQVIEFCFLRERRWFRPIRTGWANPSICSMLSRLRTPVPGSVPGKFDGVRLHLHAHVTAHFVTWCAQVWGIFCEQFSWYEGKTTVKNTPQPLYEGSWWGLSNNSQCSDMSWCECFRQSSLEHRLPSVGCNATQRHNGFKLTFLFSTGATKMRRG